MRAESQPTYVSVVDGVRGGRGEGLPDGLVADGRVPAPVAAVGGAAGDPGVGVLELAGDVQPDPVHVGGVVTRALVHNRLVIDSSRV